MATVPDRSDPSLRLENGDRLTRHEFHRRYEGHPEIKKAELIEGIVHVASRVHARDHGEPHAAAVGWLGVYVSRHRGVGVYDNATVLLDLDNEPQPGACLRYLAGRSSTLDDEGYIQ